MTDLPVISIVTVCYNGERFIADTLRSVDNQTWPRIEHIIIDGASTDDTMRILNRHQAAHRRVLSEPDSGIYDAMNKGLAFATGDCVGFLNADDMLAYPGCIADIACAFEDATIDAVYGDIVLVDPVRTHQVRRYWQPGQHRPDACAHGWMAPHPTFYVRRRILASAGGFNTAYKLQADFELELRLFEQMKIHSYYLPKTLVRMRLGGATTGSLRNVLRGNLEAACAVRSHGYAGGWRFIANKIARRMPQFLTRPD